MPYPNQVDLWGMQKAKFEGEDETPDYLRQADMYAKEKEDAYQAALKGIPDEPNPSVWRRLAAGALGAFGGYHQQFVDPRQTQAAVQGVLQGDYPTRYKNAQDAVKRAEGGVAMADRLRQRANERFRSQEEAGSRRHAADVLAESKRTATEQTWERDLANAKGDLVEEADLNSPAVQARLTNRTHTVSRSPSGRIGLKPTLEYRLDQERRAKQTGTIDPTLYPVARAEARKRGIELPEDPTKLTVDGQKLVAKLVEKGFGFVDQKALQDDNQAARMAELGARLGRDSAEAKGNAAQDLFKARTSVNLWNDTNKQYSALEAEKRKYEDAIRTNKFIMGSPEADAKRYEEIKAEQARILELAHRRDAQLRGENEDERLVRAGIKTKPGAAPAPPQAPAQASQAIPVGTVVDGHRFKGGNPKDPNSWEKI